MECHNQSLQADSLGAQPVSYQYRFCPRCRREWPAGHQSCPECVHWLGDKPLQRVEWQLAPVNVSSSARASYELIGASVLILRLVCEHPPDDKQIAQIAEIIHEITMIANGATYEVARCGWIVWTREGLPRAFRLGREIERRLTGSLPRLESILLHSVKIRWGVWIDQYIVPFDVQNKPAIGDLALSAIFNFEPDNLVLSSEAVYQSSRRWEHFVAAPRRLLDGEQLWGYRMIGHKRPSALDHAEATNVSPFFGRGRQLAKLQNCWKRSGPRVKLAITAAAGVGKTRFIKEWLRRHPDVRALVATSSLFGGTIEDFASQLAELPPDRLDWNALLEAIVGRVRREQIEVLILDDLHWADSDGLKFLQDLLAALPPWGILIVLAARPSGREQVRALKPDTELQLGPLPASATVELARQLVGSQPVAAAAALRSKGNPLFVEQFAAWAAETNYDGDGSGPGTLHQVIAARIEHLSKVRIADIRQRLRWGPTWQRRSIDDELRQLEIEIGLWLDRLGTGDFADRVQAARYLASLERLDYEIFLTSMLLGRPRPRSSRLREAIERLYIGSADQVLADLKRRAAKANSTTKENISREARRAADILFSAYQWAKAQEFYELAYSSALWDKHEVARRISECRRHGRATISNDREVHSVQPEKWLEEKPSVESIDLPYIWASLGRLYGRSEYFGRASEAALAINDYALVEWAKRKATE